MRICDRHLLDRRPIDDDAERLAAVSAVIAAVRSRGDAALRDYTERFDRVRLDDFRVPAPERALGLVGADVVAALRAAAERVEAFHRRQPTTSSIAPWPPCPTAAIRSPTLTLPDLSAGPPGTMERTTT